MADFFGPVGSAGSGAGKGLVTCKTNLYACMEEKLVQVQQSKTENIETVADPKYARSVGKSGRFSCPKNCPHWYADPSCLGRQGQAGMIRGKGARAQPQRARCCACSHSQHSCAIQQVVDSWGQGGKIYSSLSCGAS